MSEPFWATQSTEAEKIHEALKALGQDADEVAASLLAAGVRDCTTDPAGCPITAYLNFCFAGPPGSAGWITGFLMTRRFDLGDTLLLSLPKGVRKFISDYHHRPEVYIASDLRRDPRRFRPPTDLLVGVPNPRPRR